MAALGPCRQRAKTSRSAAASVGRWDILLGQRRVPPYAAHRRFKKVVNSQRTTKARRSHSLPLLTYSRLGGLRQDPGRAAESAAGPRTDEDMGARRACVVVDLWGTRRQPLVGLAVVVASPIGRQQHTHVVPPCLRPFLVRPTILQHDPGLAASPPVRYTLRAARSEISLPLLTYLRLGGLRQDPGRAAESAARPRTDEDMGARRACVVVDLWGTRRQPPVPPAVRHRVPRRSTTTHARRAPMSSSVLGPAADSAARPGVLPQAPQSAIR